GTAKKAQIPDSVTAGLPSVALRVPSHRVARALLEMAGVPVAAPSANRFSRPSPTTAAHVLADLDGRIDVVLDGGPADIGLESTIVDFTVDPPVMRRPGGLTLDQIHSVVPEVVAVSQQGRAEAAQVAPGQLTRHYAPQAELTLYLGAARLVIDRVAADARTLAAKGSRIGILAPEEDLLALAPELAALAAAGRVEVQPYGLRTDPQRSARELFAALRALDATGVTYILATAIDADGLGLAVIDRLTRAAEGRVRRV
ncbi:MAG: L-threonylcarbamoyladenylate synthase, partial [Pollutimonas bauzanensis]